MFYALAGIPLGLVCFQSIGECLRGREKRRVTIVSVGERMNTIAAKVLRMIKRSIGREEKVSFEEGTVV